VDVTGAIPVLCIHGSCRRVRDDLNGEGTRPFAEISYTMYKVTTIAQHKNRHSSAFDDRQGRDLLRAWVSQIQIAPRALWRWRNNGGTWALLQTALHLILCDAKGIM